MPLSLELRDTIRARAQQLRTESELLGDPGPIWYREFPRWPRCKGVHLDDWEDLEFHRGERDRLCMVGALLARREPAAVHTIDGAPYLVVDSTHHLDLYDQLARLEHSEAMHEAFTLGVEGYHFPNVRVGDRFCMFGFRAVITRFGPRGSMDLALIDEDGEQCGGTTIFDCVEKPLPRNEEVYIEPIRALPKSAVGRRHLIQDLAAIIQNGLA